MSELTIRMGCEADLELLADLNQQLIEDEPHDNAMTVGELMERMRHFIETAYKAYLFERGSEIIGYALVDHTRQPLYIRQFFICRDQRRNGYGKIAFGKLAALLQTDQLDIEVMYWNEAAYAFWGSLGFRERSIYMRLER
ncbi:MULTISPECIES: GNAT family N-acetyltransferase [unclassified Paenibacillus]|uniref:GNAT family N-acetyltransferase n=1 Tax=unclassified Paenibacillus TaxID=185978 RepID=UPI0010472D43|nr:MULTISPECIES: GNAT family N-acetyltransferase [unclassified Paenibacillus]NIK70576.1 GNAT superfamily N-acetyltransferase [Paenibacillus sp. BK720]TCM91059.1 acetyltransferase (GNAT) family protein [Paenibacillus sp. BK033]